jgi:hypothetical protein
MAKIVDDVLRAHQKAVAAIIYRKEASVLLLYAECALAVREVERNHPVAGAR